MRSINKKTILLGRKSLAILICCTFMKALFMIGISQDALAKAGNSSINAAWPL